MKSKGNDVQPNLKPVGALERRAEQLFFSGYLSEAGIAQSQIPEREPGRLDIRARMGRLKLFENNPEQAILHLTGALNNGLRTQFLWDALANAYLVFKIHDQAVSSTGVINAACTSPCPRRTG